MTKYAAYDDLSIYAVGDTRDRAQAAACQDAGDPQASFKTAPISDELAARIYVYGWNPNRQSFEVTSTGYLVEVQP